MLIRLRQILQIGEAIDSTLLGRSSIVYEISLAMTRWNDLVSVARSSIVGKNFQKWLPPKEGEVDPRVCKRRWTEKVVKYFLCNQKGIAASKIDHDDRTARSRL